MKCRQENIFVCFLLLLFNEGVSQEQLKISRQEGKDHFTVPDKLCPVYRTCNDYKAVNSGDPGGCNCLCTAANKEGTHVFIYTNGLWQCTSAKSIKENQDCKILMAPLENRTSELVSLKPNEARPLNLTYSNSQANCSVDATRSTYMSCDGSWIPLNKNDTDRFEIMKPLAGKGNNIYIKINSHLGGVNLDGRLVNLGFTKDCSTSIEDKNRCLLFKLQGAVTCLIDPPKPTKKKHTLQMDKSFGNSSTTATPSNPNKTNQDVVFLICGGVALVAVVFIVIIIINLRRAEQRERRRAAHTAVGPADPKFPPSHVVIVQNAVGASANGGYTDDTSSGLTDMTAQSLQSGSSGYLTDENGTKKAMEITSTKNYNALLEEDSEEDPIYENICDKCKEMNLVGPCEHVVPYDSDDGPVYENLAEEEEEGSDKEDGEKKSLDSPKSVGEGAELSKKENEISVVKEIPVSAVSEDQTKNQQDSVRGLETKDDSQDMKSNRVKRDNSKQSRKRKKKRVSTKSQGKVRKQSSTDKQIKQEKQNLVGNLEEEHTDEDDIGGEHVYDNVDNTTESDDDDHIYESVCESSDDENDGEYYNIADFEEQITTKLNATNSPETTDPYRTNPPPLPPRPSDESTQEDSSKETEEDKKQKTQPKKPQRKIRKQTTKDESTDSETEESPRLPPRLYDAEEEKTSSLGTERQKAPLLLHRLNDETEKKNTELTTTNENTENDVNPSLPPRLYDDEEEHISNDTNNVKKKKLTQQTSDKGEVIVQNAEKIDSASSILNPEPEKDTAL